MIFDNFLANHDYWYQCYQKRSRNSFPFTLSFCKALPAVIENMRIKFDPEALYFKNTTNISRAIYLIERFAEHCRNINAEPLFLLLYDARDLRLLQQARQVRPDAPVLEYLGSRQYSYVDTGAYILKTHHAGDGFQSLSAPMKHLNAAGNRLVAEALRSWLMLSEYASMVIIR